MVVLFFELGNLIEQVIISGHDQVRLTKQGFPFRAGKLVDKGYHNVGLPPFMGGNPHGKRIDGLQYLSEALWRLQTLLSPPFRLRLSRG